MSVCVYRSVYVCVCLVGFVFFGFWVVGWLGLC